MRKRLLMVVLGAVLIGITSVPASARKWGIGLGNPYVSIKYNASKKVAFEVRGAFGSGINVYSARVYRNFNPRARTTTFAGLEGGTITFDKEDIKGDGSFGMLFLGFEKPLSGKLAFAFDIGPAYISLSSEDTSVEGLEWIVNLGIYYYL